MTNFDNETRTRLLLPMTLDFDPTGSTLEVKVDSTWYPATWLGSATSRVSASGTLWSQTGRTTGYFAGPDATAAGATVLQLGSHPTETRVSLSGDVIVQTSSTIYVKTGQ